MSWKCEGAHDNNSSKVIGHSKIKFQNYDLLSSVDQSNFVLDPIDLHYMDKNSPFFYAPQKRKSQMMTGLSFLGELYL